MITFREAFDRITKAYYRNEIEPFNACGCFVGNLLNKNNGWVEGCGGLGELRSDKLRVFKARLSVSDNSDNTYSLEEIAELENVFMSHIRTISKNDEGDEAEIFQAMEAALLKLREIHESKGEIIEPLEFKKRELVTL